MEPTGGVTNIHADLRSGSQSSYNEQAVKNLPDHVFTFSWIGNGRYFEPESGDILFRFVIRSHEAAEGVIDLVAGDKYPTADDYSHFVVMGAANKGTVFPSFDTAYARPAAPPEVRVLPDTTICVNTEARLWAEGGVEYYWEDVSPVENAYRPSMADPYERNPLFRPQDPGYYTYRVMSIAQVIPGGRVFRFRVHGSFGYIRLGGCGCFRCGWLCLRLFHFRHRRRSGFRQKPKHIQCKLLSLVVLPWSRLLFAGKSLCRSRKAACGFFLLFGGTRFFFLFLLLPFLTFLLQDSFGQRGE